MKNIKSLIAVGTIVGILGVTGTAFAAGFVSPADVTAKLTGKTVEQVTADRATGKTYGTIAQEAGKLEEFQTQILEQKKLLLDQRVTDGTMTQAQADTIYDSIKTKQATCDGTGSAGIGLQSGLGFAQGMGMGRGSGQHTGMGYRGGMGINVNQ